MSDQHDLFENLLDPQEETHIVKDIFGAFKSAIPDEQMLSANFVRKHYGLDEEYDTNIAPSSTSYNPSEPKTKAEAEAEPAITHEEEFIKFVEENHKGYDNFYTPILKQQADFLKSYTIHNNDNSSIPKLTLSLLPTLLDKLTIKDLIGVQPMSGPVSLIYAMEYETGEDNRLSMDVKGYTIEAGSRKLQASMTHELMQDMRSYHQMDAEAELGSLLSSEIANEINGEFIHEIRCHAHEQTASLDYENQLLNKINTASTMIAQRSRRGFGNWIIVNPTMLARIQLAADSVDKESRERNDDYNEITYKQTSDRIQTEGLAQDGIYRDQIKVYCDMHGTNDNEILVGYNGKHVTDNGMLYAPYVMIMPSGTLVNPMTFEPVISFMTRYGKWVSPNVSNYYTKLTIE